MGVVSPEDVLMLHLLPDGSLNLRYLRRGFRGLGPAAPLVSAASEPGQARAVAI